jgi:hypothetical protein
MSNNICIRLRKLLEAEKTPLIKEINKNKYYLSQKAHYDVGWNKAEEDFLEHYLDTWATGFKAAYCNHVCDVKNDCELRAD